jgi:hypothetical protein
MKMNARLNLRAAYNALNAGKSIISPNGKYFLSDGILYYQEHGETKSESSLKSPLALIGHIALEPYVYWIHEEWHTNLPVLCWVWNADEGETESDKRPVVIEEICDEEFFGGGRSYDYAVLVTAGDLYQPTNRGK